MLSCVSYSLHVYYVFVFKPRRICAFMQCMSICASVLFCGCQWKATCVVQHVYVVACAGNGGENVAECSRCAPPSPALQYPSSPSFECCSRFAALGAGWSAASANQLLPQWFPSIPCMYNFACFFEIKLVVCWSPCCPLHSLFPWFHINRSAQNATQHVFKKKVKSHAPSTLTRYLNKL